MGAWQHHGVTLTKSQGDDILAAGWTGLRSKQMPTSITRALPTEGWIYTLLPGQSKCCAWCCLICPFLFRDIFITGVEWGKVIASGQNVRDSIIIGLWKWPWPTATFQCFLKYSVLLICMRRKRTLPHLRAQHKTSLWLQLSGTNPSLVDTLCTLCLGDKTLWNERLAPATHKQLFRLFYYNTMAGISTVGPTWCVRVWSPW